MSTTQSALITGASSGIGEQYARQLAAQGENLIITARSKDKLKLLSEELELAYDITCRVETADLATDDGIQALVKIIENTPISYLVNNAGFGIPAGFTNVPRERHRDMISVHVTAVMELTHAVLPQMMERDGGNIIVVASMTNFIGEGMYAGTKRFQVSMYERIGSLLEDSNVVIQALCPGYVRTSFHQTNDYKERGIDVRKNIPNWLWLSADDVVEYSLAKLKPGRVVVIPSLRYKLIRFISRFM